MDQPLFGLALHYSYSCSIGSEFLKKKKKNYLNSPPMPQISDSLKE